MKNKVISVLNQCIYNKTIADFNAIIELINTISDDDIADINIKYNKTSVYISMFKGYKLVSISFTDNNKLLFHLPNDISKTYVIGNCDYNIQYSDIKALLNSNN